MLSRRRPCGFHYIKINDLSVTLDAREILHDVNLRINCGTFAAIIGRNGSGKSTLLRAILGEIPHTGSIEFTNTEYGHISDPTIGYVPQTINISRSTPMDVYDLVTSFRFRTPVFFRRKGIRSRIISALDEFDAKDLIDKEIGTLSGGQLQRVLLSMAIMDQPKLLLLDEPVSGIDKNGMDLFYNKMKALVRHHDMAAIIISHDLDYVARYADHVLLLDQTVLASGTPKAVYESDAFRQMFGGSYDYGKPGSRPIPIGRYERKR